MYGVCVCGTYGDLTGNQHCSGSSHVSPLPVNREQNRGGHVLKKINGASIRFSLDVKI